MPPRYPRLYDYIGTTITNLSTEFNVPEPNWVIAPFTSGYINRFKTIVLSTSVYDLWRKDPKRSEKLIDWVVSHEFKHYLQDLEGRFPPLRRIQIFEMKELEEEADRFTESRTGLSSEEVDRIAGEILGYEV